MKTDLQITQEVAPLIAKITEISGCKGCIFVLLEDPKNGFLLTAASPEFSQETIEEMGDKIQDALDLEERPLRNFNLN